MLILGDTSSRLAEKAKRMPPFYQIAGVTKMPANGAAAGREIRGFALIASIATGWPWDRWASGSTDPPHEANVRDRGPNGGGRRLMQVHVPNRAEP
jgi:hypothetical protein